MRRRDILTLAGATAIAHPFVARAQQFALPVVGFLHSGSPGPFASLVAAFRDGLREAGYVVGRNVLIDFRWAEGNYDWCHRWPSISCAGKRRSSLPPEGL